MQHWHMDKLQRNYWIEPNRVCIFASGYCCRYMGNFDVPAECAVWCPAGTLSPARVDYIKQSPDPWSMQGTRATVSGALSLPAFWGWVHFDQAAKPQGVCHPPNLEFHHNWYLIDTWIRAQGQSSSQWYNWVIEPTYAWCMIMPHILQVASYCTRPADKTLWEAQMDISSIRGGVKSRLWTSLNVTQY